MSKSTIGFRRIKRDPAGGMDEKSMSGEPIRFKGTLPTLTEVWNQHGRCFAVVRSNGNQQLVLLEEGKLVHWEDLRFVDHGLYSAAMTMMTERKVSRIWPQPC